jgi:dTDP-4-dehydro-6-deoxy-alpha-D-glucopyranose 2,3-dehydratase
MTSTMSPATGRPGWTATAGRRLTESVLTPAEAAAGQFEPWWSDLAARHRFEVTPVAFRELTGWNFDEAGNLVHASGKFFSIIGLHVRSDYGPVPEWTQPIISQPEVGILGILVKEFGGVPHCLMQAKMEPGNVNTLQLSPTVQATRSNYTRVHRGGATRYLDYFTAPRRGRVVADVLQSEQGSWFYRKHNRNMVVVTTDDVPVHPDFCWLTLRQVLDVLGTDNVVNMDARTVLSCMPLTAPPAGRRGNPGPAEPFREALARSLDPDTPALHTTEQVMSWLTDRRARHDLRTAPMRAADVTGWTRSDHVIEHDEGKHFKIIGVRVQASSREIGSWTQPLLAPQQCGVIAFVVKPIDGVLHVLTHARVEPGFIDSVELAPTVQCLPRNYAGLPAESQPRYLDYVLAARPDQILFDAKLSEEGGRFWDAQNRYLVVEAGAEFPVVTPGAYRWLTVSQFAGLLRYSHNVSVQARSLVTCLYSLM